MIRMWSTTRFSNCLCGKHDMWKELSCFGICSFVSFTSHTRLDSVITRGDGAVQLHDASYSALGLHRWSQNKSSTQDHAAGAPQWFIAFYYDLHPATTATCWLALHSPHFSTAQRPPRLALLRHLLPPESPCPPASTLIAVIWDTGRKCKSILAVLSFPNLETYGRSISQI